MLKLHEKKISQIEERRTTTTATTTSSSLHTTNTTQNYRKWMGKLQRQENTFHFKSVYTKTTKWCTQECMVLCNEWCDRDMAWKRKRTCCREIVPFIEDEKFKAKQQKNNGKERNREIEVFYEGKKASVAILNQLEPAPYLFFSVIHFIVLQSICMYMQIRVDGNCLIETNSYRNDFVICSSFASVGGRILMSMHCFFPPNCE